MAVFVHTRTVSTGIQRFDAQRHLGQVTDLVAEVFKDELDARGRDSLGEMRLAGRLAPFLGSVLSMALFDDFIGGYVWIEDGRVVGNVTMQHADVSGARWRISNVAVDPAYRGRGIAKALMTATLGEIEECGGAWAVLQVRADNAIAHGLYTSLGFSGVCRDGIWRLPMLMQPRLPASSTVSLTPLYPNRWEPRLELAHAARSALAHWAEPIDAESYRIGLGRWLGELLGSAMGLYQVHRWGVWHDDRLDGSVEIWANLMADELALRFAVRPEARGRLEEVLLARGVSELRNLTTRPIVVYHSGDHTQGVAALEAMGFQRQRVLLTMRRAIGVRL